MKSIEPPPDLYQPPTPPTPSLEELKVQALEDVNALALHCYRALVKLQRDGIVTLWNSPLGLTPQQICDAKEGDAAAMFRDHGTLTTGIVEIAQANGINPMTGCTIADDKYVADGIMLPTHNFTINEDGTVTILATPYAP